MKKVLFVAATLGGGGAERVMLNLANQMAETGNRVAVVKTSERKNDYDIHPAIRVETAFSHANNKVLRIVGKLWKIRKIFKFYNDYTVVSFIPDVSMYATVARIGLKNRLILSERNDPAREPSKAMLRVIRTLCYLLADFVVFQTGDAQAYFEKRIQKKSCIIPNPLNLAVMPMPDIQAEKRNVITMVCRVKPQKNVGMMLDAVSKIKNQLGEAVVEIYGSGNLYRDGLQKRIKEEGLGDVIKFMGPSNGVYEILNSSKIYVSTSDYEGLSNTMLEALAMGVPSIVTDCPIGGARMFIKPEENGILIPVGDSDRLAQEMLRLLADEKLRKKLSENSIKIREELELGKITDKWLEIV